MLTLGVRGGGGKGVGVGVGAGGGTFDGSETVDGCSSGRPFCKLWINWTLIVIDHYGVLDLQVVKFSIENSELA